MSHRSLVVSLLAALVFASSTHGEVVTLTQGNFYSTIQQDPTKSWFVKWYAEWCGHCKRLRPIWDELGEWAAGQDPAVGIAKIDATKARDLADQYKVRGYPTLIYIQQQEQQYYRYAGGRTLEEFQAFLQGGYAETKADPLPAPPGWDDIMKSYQKRLKKEYAMLEEDFYHIVEVRKNAMAALLVIGGVVGLLFGCLLSAVCCRSSSGGKQKAKIE